MLRVILRHLEVSVSSRRIFLRIIIFLTDTKHEVTESVVGSILFAFRIHKQHRVLNKTLVEAVFNSLMHLLSFMVSAEGVISLVDNRDIMQRVTLNDLLKYLFSGQ